MHRHPPKPQFVIAGAGPAGASLASRLAGSGYEVTLIERERFPRHKLCGEFVSPECFAHFAELRVLDAMLGAGGDRIVRTTFFAQSGPSVSVPSAWFGDAGGALGISRARMDKLLLDRARELGVRVFESTAVTGVEPDGEGLASVLTRSDDGERRTIRGDIFVDATGRHRHLAKFVRTSGGRTPPARRLVGFKTHLSGARIERGNCEIYFFDGGYGGLSFVEEGLANHCFLVEADRFKAAGSVDRLLEELVFRNRRAAAALCDSVPRVEWLAVSVDAFGRRSLRPAENLFTVGDAAAFIDPFTGSGMLMALESSRIFAGAVQSAAASGHPLGELYEHRYRSHFARRLRICGLLRGAAFRPRVAAFAIAGLSRTANVLKLLAQATRPSTEFIPRSPET
jgi:flavin-dependent dehydrogenase